MKIINYLTLVISMILMIGCSKDTSPIDQMGEITVYLVDSPANFDEVNIMVNRLEVHKSDIAQGDSGWIVINDQPAMYNLLDFRNGVTTVLGNSKLDPGHYTQMRLIIDSGSHVIVDGIQYDLYIPSGSTSGFKFTHAFTIEENTLYELTVDFDVKQSVFLTGSSRYTLQPTLRLVPNIISGTISGTVLPLDALPLVWTLSDTDSVFAYPDSTGFFKLMALPEGMYDINIIPENNAYNDTTLFNIEVIKENNTDLGTINLQ